MIEAGPSLIKGTGHLKQRGGRRDYWMSLSLVVDFLSLPLFQKKKTLTVKKKKKVTRIAKQRLLKDQIAMKK